MSAEAVWLLDAVQKAREERAQGLNFAASYHEGVAAGLAEFIIAAGLE